MAAKVCRIHSLVVCVANPRECTQDGDDDEDVCHNSSNENSPMSVLVVDEDEHYSKDEPSPAGECTTTVDSTKVLQDWGKACASGRQETARQTTHPKCIQVSTTEASTRD